MLEVWSRFATERLQPESPMSRELAPRRVQEGVVLKEETQRERLDRLDRVHRIRSEADQNRLDRLDPSETIQEIRDDRERLDRTREFVLNMGATFVGPGQDALIHARPQIIFRPERFIIPSSVAPDFLIVDIKIGPNSQFGGIRNLAILQPFRAEILSELAQPVKLNFESCYPGRGITLHVRNVTNRRSQFIGVVIGPSIV